jgi:hypothetical protein
VVILDEKEERKNEKMQFFTQLVQTYPIVSMDV